MASLLDVIAASLEPPSLKALSAETGLHASTAFRVLGSLIEHEFVERDEIGRYRLGVRLLQLGRRVRQQLDLQREAKAVMEALRDELGETVNLTLREGDEVVYVERAISNRMMRVEQVIGSRAPLHVTAVGKLMLGDEGAAGCAQYAQRTGLPAFTDNTITDPAKLATECTVGAQRGFALDNQEAEIGVGCIGVLIRDSSGHAVAGLSVSAPIERRQDEWIQKVIDAGQRLSQRLGHSGSAN